MTTDSDLDALIPPGVLDHVGTPLPTVVFPDPISSSDVRRFANATGDVNPLWFDDEFARRAGYEGRVVPPEFVPVLSWRLLQMGEATEMLWADIPPPDPYHQKRNAGTEMEWLAPVYVEDRVAIRRTLEDVTVREGRAGIGIYVRYVSEYLNQHEEVVVRQRQTTVWLAEES